MSESDQEVAMTDREELWTQRDKVLVSPRTQMAESMDQSKARKVVTEFSHETQ